MAFIQFSKVSLAFGDRDILKEVSVNLKTGTKAALTGANGAGKSTLIKIMAGLVEPDSGKRTAQNGARIAYLPQSGLTHHGRTLKEEADIAFDYGYKIQDQIEEIGERLKQIPPENAAAQNALLEQHSALMETLENSGWYRRESLAESVLLGLGFSRDDFQKMTDAFSGGWQMRIALAKALMQQPDILLLDEPTNGLDLESIAWLEEFLMEFPNIVIVVSHDRHFLNSVCTYICDIDYGKISQFTGNYDFWYQMSQIMQRQAKDQAKKREEKIADLKEFIQRFASNAAKSRQATSRKKVLETLELEELPVTSRKFPYVNFRPERSIGNNVLETKSLCLCEDDEKLLDNFSLVVNRTDKVAFVGIEHNSISALFDIVAGRRKADSGEYFWGQTAKFSYLPRDNSAFFENDCNITEWLKQYSPDQNDAYVRGFLGRMLFSGDESLKSVRVLSGGEKVRCMLSRMMLSGANVLILDDPTNHLDLEAIQSLNEALVGFPGVVLFTSHDHEFIQSIANRIVEITPRGIIDRMMPFDDYRADKHIAEMRKEFYEGSGKKIRL